MSSPVANYAAIIIIKVLVIIFRWSAGLVDVQGAFQCVNLKDKDTYMQVPEGFEKFYLTNVVLLLLQTLHGLKQASRAFWREVYICLDDMKYEI
jgi:hypothetical protein